MLLAQVNSKLASSAQPAKTVTKVTVEGDFVDPLTRLKMKPNVKASAAATAAAAQKAIEEKKEE